MTDDQLTFRKKACQDIVASAYSTPEQRIRSMSLLKRIERELDRREALKCNPTQVPSVQPFDLDGFEKQNGWRRD